MSARAAVLEREARADDEVAHGSRTEDLAGLGLPHHTRADVYGDPADVLAAFLDLARVETGPDVDADPAQEDVQL